MSITQTTKSSTSIKKGKNKFMTNARQVALEALLKVSENEGYSNIVLDKALKVSELSERDKALASRIFYGVLEKRITLDFYITKFLSNPHSVIESIVKEILRIAVYQVLFLDKIPDNAIVNEAVNMAKENKRDKLAPFVNGVLRELLRKKDLIELPNEKSLTGQSVKYSIPVPLIKMWKEAYGDEVCESILESFEATSKIYIRLNSTKNETVNGIKKYEYLDHAYEYALGGSITDVKGFEEGLFHVQDLSSQYLCKILDPKENEDIIDVCAAPGGKTFTIAQMMNNTGRVFSYDLYKGRVKLIRAGAYRLGLTNVLASLRDATSDTCEITGADKILCDVPCSGFGTIRRKPEIRYKDLEDMKSLNAIQYDILKKSSKHLKVGGVLVYSTCTLNPKENGEIADKFLRENKDFQPLKIDIPKGLKRTIKEPENQLTMMPYSTDGFFVAKFIKRG